jgi:hypothetical protein
MEAGGRATLKETGTDCASGVACAAPAAGAPQGTFIAPQGPGMALYFLKHLGVA